ncbi:Rhodanese-like protein [Marasmius fiardii PR-910]|nr:Rhodanese-like protein [Marasmius fiardii PR-910]
MFSLLPLRQARLVAARTARIPRSARGFSSKGPNANLVVDSGSVKVITYDLLKPKTQTTARNTTLIDVREPTEVRGGMIPTAVNIPLRALHDSLKYSPEDFRKMYGVAKPGRSEEITFYCNKGLRSQVASDIAIQNGFTNILDYRGSWVEWARRERKKRF